MIYAASAEMNGFVRVIERGSFARRRRGSRLTPSALSKLVTRIEDRLGVRLLTRTTRRLALTAEGDLFWPAAGTSSHRSKPPRPRSRRPSRLPRGHLRISVGTAAGQANPRSGAPGFPQAIS
jgi:DNA-binding transcriptional LysR family regulator